jgi:hypothetical protein
MTAKKVLLSQRPFRAYADTHTFIIRIWQEGSQECNGENNWRGIIDHVGYNQNLYFIEGDGIVRFIEEQTGIRLRRSVPWWRSLLARFRHAKR